MFFPSVFLIAAAFLFRASVTNMLGAVGRGYFSSVYGLFLSVLIIAFAGIPEALARAVAADIKNDRFRDARLVSRIASRLVVFSGAAAMVVVFIIAYPYAKLFAGTKVLPSIFIIAVSVVPCCVASVIRGYYEGLDRYSSSKIIRMAEIIAQCGFALLFVKLFKDKGALQFGAAKTGTGGAVVFGTTVSNLTSANSVIAVRAALGAALGVMLGSIIGAVFAFVYNRLKGDGLTKKQLALSPKAESPKALTDGLISSALPFAAGAAVLFVAGIIDISVIQLRLNYVLADETGFNLISQMFAEAFSSASSSFVLNLSDKEETAKYLFGIYCVSVDMISVFVLLVSMVTVPFMRRSVVTENETENETFGFESGYILKKAMVYTMLPAFCSAFLAKPVFTLVFGRGAFADTMQISSRIIMITGFTAIFIALSVVGLGFLCAAGKTGLAVKIIAASSVIKIVLDFLLIGIPKLNLYGAVIGNAAFFVVAAVCTFAVLAGQSIIRADYTAVFIKPALCGALSAFSGYCSNLLLCIIIPDFNQGEFLSGKTVSILVSLVFSILVYIISMLFVQEFTENELFSLSKGEKIAKTLEKYGFLS